MNNNYDTEKIQKIYAHNIHKICTTITIELKYNLLIQIMH